LTELASLDLGIKRSSLAESADAEWGVAQAPNGRRLVVLASPGAPVLRRLDGETSDHLGRTLLVGPTSERNARTLRESLPWLNPTPLGVATSAGFGDRLGLATPGHILALREAGAGIRPVFAQQSMREMARTGRTPQQVLDEAMWGAFEEGWREGFGADGDHLKEPEDIDRTRAAGFTLFTIDPGAHVDGSAATLTPSALQHRFESLPWDRLEDSIAALRRRHLGRTIDLDGVTVAFDDGSLARAAVKYGRAVAHVAAMFRHLEAVAAGRAFELEVSVDETDEPTSHAEHVYVATELARLGVRWVSLAPRFVGRFEKGVDYIGDLGAFERHFAGHAAIARALGPYKISLHSGSDKFRIYPIAAEHARGLVHLKTAGTSYLEALRVVADLDPPLFREMYGFAREHYEADRASYHVSARLDRAPEGRDLADDDLDALLDQFDAREMLHVTFGSVLTARDGQGRPRFASRLGDVLRSNPAAYATTLRSHFARHLAPFVAAPRELVNIPGIN
jgi:hypothetical protein